MTMRVWHFSEVPYPDFPHGDEAQGLRVTMPNRVCDPRTASDLYHRRIDEWIAADALGLDVMVNEHHQTPTCINSAAPLILSILARSTSRARLLILGNPIANRRQPIRVAEEMAMIDVLSRGRLECGLVRGVPSEIAPGNSNPVRQSERMWEAHDMIVKAWTSHDGPTSFEGRFFHHRMINIWPRPWQQPHPPLWVASMSEGGAAEVGRRGHVLATFLTGYGMTPRVFASYGKGWQAAGHPGRPPADRLAYAGFVYVGETDEAGRAGGRKLLWQMGHQGVGPLAFRNPPGYNPPAANVAAFRAGRLVDLTPTSRPDLDEQIERGTIFCGSPDTVFRQLRRFHEAVGGFGHLLAIGQAGEMDSDETIRGMTLLAREVLPRLKELERPTMAA